MRLLRSKVQQSPLKTWLNQSGLVGKSRSTGSGKNKGRFQGCSMFRPLYFKNFGTRECFVNACECCVGCNDRRSECAKDAKRISPPNRELKKECCLPAFEFVKHPFAELPRYHDQHPGKENFDYRQQNPLNFRR